MVYVIVCFSTTQRNLLLLSLHDNTCVIRGSCKYVILLSHYTMFHGIVIIIIVIYKSETLL